MIPQHDSLARWVNALWLEPLKTRAKIPQFFALTFWRDGYSLRIVTFASSWFIFMEQVSRTQFRVLAETDDASALYRWICQHYPVEANILRWRPEPWPKWRHNDLPTRVGDVL